MTALPTNARGASLTLYGVVADSMRPTLDPGDAVIVEHCASARLRRGDIVLVRRGDGVVCHRLLRRRRGRLHTQGDNRWRPDPPADETALAGRVVSRIRPGHPPARLDGFAARWRGMLRLLMRRLLWQADRLRRRAVEESAAS